MRESIVEVAIWLIVPAILAGIIVFARSIVYRTAEGEHRLSVRAGHYAGFVAFVTYVVAQIQVFEIPRITELGALQLRPESFVIAAVAGYFLVYLIRSAIPTRIGGFMVLLLVFAGSTALYSYFFVQTFNNAILSSTLGLAFGVLIHAVISPKSIYDIFPEIHRDPFEREPGS